MTYEKSESIYVEGNILNQSTEGQMLYARCARTSCDERSRDHSKYCSDYCMKKHNNDMRPKVRKTAKKCVVCGTRFIGKADAKSCSSTCRTRLQRQRERASAA